jgi:hypothetical protein
MVVGVTVLVCKTCPPIVLYIPLKPTPVVRWMTIVTDSEVRTPVLSSRIASSLYQGPLALTAAVTVTPPLPPPPSLTVRLTGVVRVNAPLVPVTLIVAAPSGAALDTERVRTLLPPVAGLGLKFAVTPAGSPLALNVTPPVNPPLRVTAIVLVPLAPRLTVRLAGLAEMAKSGVCASLTVRPTVAVRVRVPPLPVIVTAAAPSVAVLDAVRVKTLLAPVAGFVLKLAVTPAGNPLALNVTPPVNPPLRVIAIVLVPFAPRTTVRLAGDEDRAKSGVAGWLTVRLTGVVRVRVPPIPVKVTAAAPSVAVLDAVRVITLLPPVAGLGLKLAVTPAGNPLALNVTPPVNPPLRVIAIVLVPLAPRLTVRLAGLAENEKSGVAGPGSAPKTLVAPS